ncbi:methyltransferase domain-containing protein [Laceyella putida]|uniref:Methyltransferase domain-containing protein n=1 Tax=Laceyella putida TaxID=110101 RepID=A0ABW2RR30_9BACL
MNAYDEWYRQPGYYWGTAPSQLAQRLISLAGQPTGKKVVDLGSGEGKECIYFAKQGLQVTGVDLSRVGLAKTVAWAEAERLAIRTVHADVRTHRLTEPVDLLYSSGTLQYLSPDIRAERFRHFQEQTNVGGLHAINVFVDKSWLPIPPDWQAHESFYKSGELLSYYADWEILHCDEFLFDCHSSGVPHRHALQVMVAKKIV